MRASVLRWTTRAAAVATPAVSHVLHGRPPKAARTHAVFVLHASKSHTPRCRQSLVCSRRSGTRQRLVGAPHRRAGDRAHSRRSAVLSLSLCERLPVRRDGRSGNRRRFVRRLLARRPALLGKFAGCNEDDGEDGRRAVSGLPRSDFSGRGAGGEDASEAGSNSPRL
uniref:Uncharacterized protein n=1 Tax=Plectus sambesii TaxID=2011161 RepID=A0A914WTZ4_9BILA